MSENELNVPADPGFENTTVGESKTDTGTTAQPSDYDREQDEKIADKDQQIEDLKAQLARFQAEQGSTDVTQTPAPEAQVNPIDNQSGTSTPVQPEVNPLGHNVATSPDAEATFHETPAPADAAPVVGAGGGDINNGSSVLEELTTDEKVDVTPVPEPESTEVQPTPVSNVKDGTAEILAIVKDVQEDIKYVKSRLQFVEENAPKLVSALEASPFGKMLPTLLG